MPSWFRVAGCATSLVIAGVLTAAGCTTISPGPAGSSSTAPSQVTSSPATSSAGVPTSASPSASASMSVRPAKPAVTEPAVTKPAVAKPAVTKPAVAKPAVTTTLVPTGRGTLTGQVVVLDPGHNVNNSSSINKPINAGNGVTKACDTVGTSTNGGYPEHAFTWDVANRAATILRGEGATVLLTRTSDSGIGPCVPARAQIGNDAHADVFVAIHADGGPTNGHGFFVMQPPPHNPNVNPGGAARSRVLATTMHDVFHATTGIPYSSYIAGGYYPDSTTTGTINLSHGPVVTIECLDMRSSSDAAIATNPSWRHRIAAGIAAGITAFLTH